MEEFEQRNIVKFTGRAKQPDEKNEKNRWQRFLTLLQPWAKKANTAVNMAEEYGCAEISKKQGEATLLEAQALEVVAQAELKKQEKVKIVNDIITDIFADNQSPESVKMLKLANLLANNPEIAEQVEKIQTMMNTLKVINFTEIFIEVAPAIELKLPKNEEEGL